MLQQVAMGILSGMVQKAIAPYADDTEYTIHPDDLARLRRRVDDIVDSSPFAGLVHVLVGFDITDGSKLAVAFVHTVQVRGEA